MTCAEEVHADADASLPMDIPCAPVAQAGAPSNGSSESSASQPPGRVTPQMTEHGVTLVTSTEYLVSHDTARTMCPSPATLGAQQSLWQIPQHVPAAQCVSAQQTAVAISPAHSPASAHASSPAQAVPVVAASSSSIPPGSSPASSAMVRNLPSLDEACRSQPQVPHLAAQETSRGNGISSINSSDGQATVLQPLACPSGGTPTIPPRNALAEASSPASGNADKAAAMSAPHGADAGCSHEPEDAADEWDADELLRESR